MWSSVVESDASLSEARHEASAALQLAGCARPLIDDVDLIITDLTLDETGGDFDGAEPSVMAASDEFSGRVRAIVAALSDRFETKRTAPNQTEHVVAVRTADSAT